MWSDVHSSAIEHRTRNEVSLDSNHFCYHFKVWAFSFSPQHPSSFISIKEYIAVDSDGNVNSCCT